jgi:fatty acid desaturase
MVFNGPPHAVQEAKEGSPLVDFWYGGLNYQIEHHLSPTMPRNKLRQARPIIMAFCKEHGIAYCETSMLQSYKEILHFLHQVSAPLREEIS